MHNLLPSCKGSSSLKCLQNQNEELNKCLKCYNQDQPSVNLLSTHLFAYIFIRSWISKLAFAQHGWRNLLAEACEHNPCDEAFFRHLLWSPQVFFQLDMPNSASFSKHRPKNDWIGKVCLHCAGSKAGRIIISWLVNCPNSCVSDQFHASAHGVVSKPSFQKAFWMDWVKRSPDPEVISHWFLPSRRLPPSESANLPAITGPQPASRPVGKWTRQSRHQSRVRSQQIDGV